MISLLGTPSQRPRHRTNIKELVSKNEWPTAILPDVDCDLAKNLHLKTPQKTTANSQLSCTLCTSVKGNPSIPPGGSSLYSLTERGKSLCIFFNGNVDVQTVKQNSSHHSRQHIHLQSRICLIKSCKWHWHSVRGEKIGTNSEMDKIIDTKETVSNSFSVSLQMH